MRGPLVPSRVALRVLAGLPVAALVAAAVQGSLAAGWRFFVGSLAFAAAWAAVDLARSVAAWRAAPLQWHRRLPAALARGVPHTLACALVNEGRDDWWVTLAEAADPGLELQGLPLEVYVPAHSRIELRYTIVPRRRGTMRVAPAEITLRTLHGSFRWQRHSGNAETVRVLPDFTVLARHDALARAGRLAELGLRALPAAAEDGGDTLWLLLDAGPSLRERFDEALDALLLLAHVAVRAGDAVGAITVGAAEADTRIVAPRHGASALEALMTVLFDVQPHDAPSDLPGAAGALMEGQRAPADVIVITGLREEGPSDLGAALRLLRTRHAVWVARLGDASRLATALVNHYVAARSRRGRFNPRASASRR